MPSFRRSYSGPSGYKPPEEEDPIEVVDPNLDTPESVAPPPPEEAPVEVPVPAFPRTPDHSADLAALREREDTLRKQGVIASMGDKINAAFMGRAPDSHAADAFTSQAALEKNRYGEDRALEANRIKEDAAATLADPNSAANVQYRATIAPVLGERMVKSIGPAFNRLTKAQIEGIIPNLKTRFDQDKSLDEAMAKADAARTKALSDEAQFDETKRHNRESERISDITAHRVSTGEGGSDGSEADGTQNRHVSNKISDLAKYMESKAGAMENFMRIERRAPGLVLGNVPPGLDENDWERVKAEGLRKVGGRQISDQTIQDIGRTVQDIAQEIRHDRFGATLTGPEAESFLRVFDDSIRSGWQSQALALDLFRRQLGAKVNAKLSFYEDRYPEETASYMQKSGYGVVMPLFRTGLNKGFTGKSEAAPSSDNAPSPVRTPPKANTAAGLPTPTPVAAPAPAPSAAPAKAPVPDGTRKVKNGINYIKQNGQWVAE